MKIRVFHQPYEPYAYAIQEKQARLVFLMEPKRAARVFVHFADRYAEELTDVLEMKASGFDGTYTYYEIDVPVPTRKLKYAFEVRLAEDTWWCGELGLFDTQLQAGVFQLAYIGRTDLFCVPDWVNHAVCYQIFPERFANGNPNLSPAQIVSWDSTPAPNSYFGGDIPGITQNLGYLKDLGVNLIYLTPIFKAHSNHKYDTADYFEIDEQFGTKSDVLKLVDTAHRLGMRIILDAVFNHSGFWFRPFQDVIQKGKESSYFDWFYIDGDVVDIDLVNYETFMSGIKSMPKLNVNHPEVERYLLEVGAYWVREFDIDGWRLDVANEVEQGFWRKFRAAVKGVKKDALILGEVWHNSLPWLKGDQFDGVMNYVFRELCLGLIVRQTMSVQTFAESLTRLYYMYPEQATRSMFNLLGSHDTERILTLAENDVAKVKLAFLLQFAYPGIPMVYYGDEVGMVGGRDPDCRRGMTWDESLQNSDLKVFVQSLASLKANHPAFAGSGLTIRKAKNEVLEFERTALTGEKIIITVNLGKKPLRMSKVKSLVSTHPGLQQRGIQPMGALIWEES